MPLPLPFLFVCHRRQVYNCSGIHLPASLGPWGEGGFILGRPAADLSMHSNAAFAAINFVRAWDADPNPDFARTVALPFVVEALAFYRDWVVCRSVHM